MIVLAGPPNVGKTALFNALTGLHQKVANYAGVTVSSKQGELTLPKGSTVKIVDLPGVYSLDPISPEEQVSRDFLFHTPTEISEPIDLVLAVIDTTQLDRNLSFVLELKKTGLPILVVLNMADLAERAGLRLDLPALSRELGLQVVPAVAVTREGVHAVIAEIENWVTRGFKRTQKLAWTASTQDQVRERFHHVEAMLQKVRRPFTRADAFTDRVDRIVLHPVWGTLALVTILVALFQSVFNLATIPQAWIQSAIEWLKSWVMGALPEGLWRGLLTEGVIAGVGSVLVFLPQIMLLFLFILALEDSGYMARAAVFLDRLMRKVGLHGRALIPLISSYACAVPGILSTRTIPNPRDRLATILIAPLTTCSARLPVYTLIIAAFIPNQPVWGPLRLQGLVLIGLYLLGVGFALIVGFTLKQTLLKGEQPILLLELPKYQWPHLRNLRMGLRERVRAFLQRAGTVILGFSVLLWFLVTFPRPAADGGRLSETGGLVHEPAVPAITQTYAGRLGHAIEPLLRPIGFDWRISVSLIPGFAAREVVVGALATVFAVESGGARDEGKEPARTLLGARMREIWGLPTALSMLVWYVFAPQCVSTLVVAKRETGSWKWTLFMFGYLLALAYGMAYVTFKLATLWA